MHPNQFAMTQKENDSDIYFIIESNSVIDRKFTSTMELILFRE